MKRPLVAVGGQIHELTGDTLDPSILPTLFLKREYTVDFGTSCKETLVQVSIDEPLITTGNIILLCLYGSGNREIDGLIENIQLSSSNIVDGIGFTLNAYAPNGANGIYNIHCTIM